MADEPRRSGRATKGQHTKMQESPDPTDKKQKPKSKSSKKSAEPEANEEEEEEEEELIRCVCGIQSDEGGRMMICCDNCQAWQHNDCMGVTEVEEQVPENYLCEECAPVQHKDLVDAMARGERPWEEVARRRLAAEQDKKKKKKGKPSRSSLKPESSQETGTPAKESQTTAGSESNKRKYEGDESTNGAGQPTKFRKPSTPAATEPVAKAKSRKSGTPVKPDHKAQPPSDSFALAKSISEIGDKARTGVATSLKKKLQTVIPEVSAKGLYKMPEGHSPDTLSEEKAILIEYAMFMNHCDQANPNFAGQYKGAMLRILPNIEKNTDLVLKLLTGALTADQLSTMTSEEMASEEHRQRMASMKEQVEKQSILLQDDSGPRVRRTHKGEEIVDDQNRDFANETTMTAPVPVRRESGLDQPSPGAGSPDGGRQISPPHVGASGAAEPSAGHRRSSSNFDMANVFGRVEANRSQSFQRGGQSGPDPQSRVDGDPDIDRLLDGDDNDSAPYSPTEYERQSSVAWKGRVEMPTAAAFQAAAQFVAGSNLEGRIPSLSALFPRELMMHGRIASDRADDYLSGLSASSSTDVTVFQLNTSSVEDSQVNYDKLYDYLNSRKRFGVVGEQVHPENVRDIYIVPLEAGAAPMPTFLQRLADNAIEQPRPRRLLLVVFVCKWKSSIDSAQATPTGGFSGSAMSPTSGRPNSTPGPGPAMSPAGYGQQMPVHPQALPTHPANVIPGSPYAQAPHPHQAPTPLSSAEEQAARILGSWANSPTAKQLIAANPSEQQLRNIHTIFQNHPQAMEDFNAFQAALTQSSHG